MVLPVAALAQESGEAKILRLFYTREQLVTAPSRVPEEARTAPAVVSVFTAEDIENMGARTLSDLLRTLASVYVTFQTSSRDSVWFRGVRNRYNDKVLLLVDGVPWRDVVYEHASVDEYFPLTNVARVEVIRGPGSALYGTNAYAGVIQVITKSPPKEKSFRAAAEAGNWDDKKAWVEGGGSIGKTGIYAWAQAFQTDGDGVGINVRNQQQAQNWDPKRQASGGVTLTHGEFTLRAEMVHYFHTYFADTDTPVWRWKDEGYWYDDSFLDAEYSHAFSSKVSMKALMYGQDYDWKNFWRQFAPGRDTADATQADVDDTIDVTKHTRRLGGEFQLNVKATGRQEIVAGVTAERESILNVQDLWTDTHTGEVTRPYYIDPVTLTTWAAYLQDTWKPAGWVTLTGGLRADHHTLFGWHLSPRLGAAFH
ncbi:MAG: TonB-dependent receptor, partial [Acidobacteria bacterium]|nr:TonB-dependent receptor [Acidobacteriota bacterium]